jgi:hypothetical protein
MRYEFREGDWVGHHSCPEPLRVIGIGTTIAVQFPNGAMWAFEPIQLEKVAIPKTQQPRVAIHEHRRDLGLGVAERFVFVAMAVVLICLVTLVLMAIASAAP